MTFNRKNLPENISELTIEDMELLLEAIRTAGQLPRFMNDMEASFRLGWIIGMLSREVMIKQIGGSKQNE